MNKKFEYFYIGNTNSHIGLFDQDRGKESSPNKVPDGNINMINEISNNNGISKKGNSTHIFNPPAITVSVNYAKNVFFQEETFCASVNILILKAEWMTMYPKAALYIVTMLKNNNKKYDYQYKISKDKLNDTKILLPIMLDENEMPIIDNAKQYHNSGYIPDFCFMEEKIRELEVERIRELEAYLKAAGLDDYQLTEEDKEVLNEKKEVEPFKIGDLFVSSNGDTDIQKKHLNGKGCPVVSSGLENNGVVGCTDLKAKIFDANTITIDMFGNAFYRNFKYKLVTHARVFSLKPNDTKIKLNQNVAIYIITRLRYLSRIYSYDKMCTFDKIKDKNILLPVKNGTLNQIDFNYMEKYMKAMQKIAIADVVKYKDSVIEATKKVVNND